MPKREDQERALIGINSVFQARITLLSCCCLLIGILSISIDAAPLLPAVVESEYLMDSPQHLIKKLNYASAPVAAVAQPRMAKSDEDGQLMYVVIKPAPPVKKYRPDNKAIFMDGVMQKSDSAGNDRRTPRLNMASGAYPVFYSIASANGKFGRNIRALTKEEISQAEAKMQL